jgi:glycosyltransferase involved in cell wall biosynthesis
VLPLRYTTLMKTALIADWLPTFGGAEHVVSALRGIWPDAPVFTTVAKRGNLGLLDAADIRTGRLQWLYRLIGRHQYLLPLMPRAIEDIDLRGYDLIISSSHAVGKGVIPPSNAVHVCYCHTPMRYAWEMEEEYLKDFRIREPLKTIVRRQLKRLRRWDLSTARRVDVFIANSSETQERIARIYGRESTVITPPVEDRFFDAPAQPQGSDSYFLAIGRLVPYKRFDLLIELANALTLPLWIGGTGTERARLQAMAGPTVKFLGFVPDADLPALYAGAKAVLFPQVEDAGIVPLEAMASGTPVIALGRGGALDVVVDGVTGLLVPDQHVDAFSAAVTRANSITWNRTGIRDHARRFSDGEFKRRIAETVQQSLTRKTRVLA